MAKRTIDPVKDNYDKQRTYKEQLQKHARAMKGEFYFEAIMIDYALMEDRLRSMIYHMGLLRDRMATRIYHKHRSMLVEMVTASEGADAAKTLGLTNISDKMKLVRSVLHWAESAGEDQPDAYRAALRSRCRAMDLEEMKKTLEGIEDWCAYRNEIVHAMMNKNMDSLTKFLNDRAAEGLVLARTLDKHLRVLKKGNQVRLAAGLSAEK